MAKFKVTIENDEAIENVSGWQMSGDILLLHFPDGSSRGLRGFVDFRIEPVDEEKAENV